jgi:hypothetical protein
MIVFDHILSADTYELDHAKGVKFLTQRGFVFTLLFSIREESGALSAQHGSH